SIIYINTIHLPAKKHRMAEMIRVTVVNEDGESIRAQPVVLKPDPPISCQAVITLLQAGGVGQGFLLQEGVTLRLDDWVTAGNYTYCLPVAAPAQAAAGAQHLGQSTFRRGITKLKAAVEASNNQLREDVARIQNELADVRRQMEDGTCIGASAPQGSLRLSLVSTGALPKWWVLGLRLIFVNAGPLACVAYQLTVEEQGTSVWATSMYSIWATGAGQLSMVTGNTFLTKHKAFLVGNRYSLSACHGSNASTQMLCGSCLAER
ncbi:hypothetical protein QJQ45_019390, partial [Haematococcus lacustris]